MRNAEITGTHDEKQEGPPVARAMLEAAGASQSLIERVCWLIAHHHTYDEFDGLDYRILIEADYLVNAYENHASHDAIGRMRERIFRTRMGKRLLDTMFLSE